MLTAGAVTVEAGDEDCVVGGGEWVPIETTSSLTPAEIWMLSLLSTDVTACRRATGVRAGRNWSSWVRLATRMKRQAGSALTRVGATISPLVFTH